MTQDIPTQLKEIKPLKTELSKFMMCYKFALKEIETKINQLEQELEYVNEYNPVKQVVTRVKSPQSILRKVNSKGIPFSLDVIREEIHDIAGVRITCLFTDDIYEISRKLLMQKDIKVVDYKNYIKYPKQNGYRSLHLIIQVPVLMSDGIEYVNVEVQIRTVAMDYWASLEHKLYNKYNKEIPFHIALELREAAHSAAVLDEKMERLRLEMEESDEISGTEADLLELWISNDKFQLPSSF
ncbi:GTP pyrophosphokinase family protein [Aciduricibacillus chroicocephali]|uniref:GTP pyrophosphokinase family protein n=1 Tax=Aciduricibacillus chroicocephali TaxID=3054939 RepID=A0ABY9KY04_9BACI|nr:GTP pyrophosphokinase family protein [Bacillaceae bacterium 44XB]